MFVILNHLLSVSFCGVSCLSTACRWTMWCSRPSWGIVAVPQSGRAGLSHFSYNSIPQYTTVYRCFLEGKWFETISIWHQTNMGPMGGPTSGIRKFEKTKAFRPSDQLLHPKQINDVFVSISWLHFGIVGMSPSASALSCFIVGWEAPGPKGPWS